MEDNGTRTNLRGELGQVHSHHFHLQSWATVVQCELKSCTLHILRDINTLLYIMHTIPYAHFRERYLLQFTYLPKPNQMLALHFHWFTIFRIPEAVHYARMSLFTVHNT